MRSERLLQAMQKTISHDLPNQIVVLQSLLQMLHEEESAVLSDDGREYVRRLIHATRRAGDLVRYLKELDRMNTLACKTEAIALPALARELQGELQRIHTGQHFEFDWRWNAPTIVGDSRVYLQALLELFAGALRPQAKRCLVSASSEPRQDAIELTFRIDDRIPGAKAAAPVEAIDQRLEWMLSREWLHLCGAGVELAMPSDGVTMFSIRTPVS